MAKWRLLRTDLREERHKSPAEAARTLWARMERVPRCECWSARSITAKGFSQVFILPLLKCSSSLLSSALENASAQSH